MSRPAAWSCWLASLAFGTSFWRDSSFTDTFGRPAFSTPLTALALGAACCFGLSDMTSSSAFNTFTLTKAFGATFGPMAFTWERTRFFSMAFLAVCLALAVLTSAMTFGRTFLDLDGFRFWEALSSPWLIFGCWMLSLCLALFTATMTFGRTILLSAFPSWRLSPGLAPLALDLTAFTATRTFGRGALCSALATSLFEEAPSSSFLFFFTCFSFGISAFWLTLTVFTSTTTFGSDTFGLSLAGGGTASPTTWLSDSDFASCWIIPGGGGAPVPTRICFFKSRKSCCSDLPAVTLFGGAALTTTGLTVCRRAGGGGGGGGGGGMAASLGMSSSFSSSS